MNHDFFQFAGKKDPIFQYSIIPIESKANLANFGIIPDNRESEQVA